MKTQDLETLKKADALHDEAMDIAMHANLAMKSDRLDESKKLHWQAFELERQAAEIYKEHGTDELWRAVLFRSAAWLAFHAKRYLETLDMVRAGLALDPPEYVEQQLLEVLEQLPSEIKRHRLHEMKVAA
ncbi:MAG: hypothetical protein AAB316_06505 [Bacteroidota bacterium]